MSVEVNKALVCRFIDEIFVGGRFDSVDELVADEFVPHTWPSTSAGKDALRRAMELVSKGLANATLTIEDIHRRA